MSGPDRVQEQHIEQKSELELPVRRESREMSRESLSRQRDERRERERDGTRDLQTARPRARSSARSSGDRPGLGSRAYLIMDDPASTLRSPVSTGHMCRETSDDAGRPRRTKISGYGDIIDHLDLRAGGRSPPAARSACIPALHTPRPRPPPPPQSSSRRRREGKLMELSVGVISSPRRPASSEGWISSRRCVGM